MLQKLPIHLTTVIAKSNESLAEEFASTKVLEDILNEIYASCPPEHANQIFDKLAEEIVKELTPCFEHFVNSVVIWVMFRYNGLWANHSRQRAQKYSEDVQKADAELVKARKLLDNLKARLGKSNPGPQVSWRHSNLNDVFLTSAWNRKGFNGLHSRRSGTQRPFKTLPILGPRIDGGLLSLLRRKNMSSE